jgi:hypothetical protein
MTVNSDEIKPGIQEIEWKFVHEGFPPITTKPNSLKLLGAQVRRMLTWVSIQWRPVAHEPDVPERIYEPALPMGSPWRLVVLNIVKITRCARFQSACDHCVRVVTEHFDPCGCDPKLRGTFPTIVRRFPQEKRRTSNL